MWGRRLVTFPHHLSSAAYCFPGSAAYAHHLSPLARTAQQLATFPHHLSSAAYCFPGSAAYAHHLSPLARTAQQLATFPHHLSSAAYCFPGSAPCPHRLSAARACHRHESFALSQRLRASTWPSNATTFPQDLSPTTLSRAGRADPTFRAAPSRAPHVPCPSTRRPSTAKFRTRLVVLYLRRRIAHFSPPQCAATVRFRTAWHAAHRAKPHPPQRLQHALQQAIRLRSPLLQGAHTLPPLNLVLAAAANVSAARST